MPKSVQFKIWKQIYENNVDRCTCNFNEDKDQIKENKLYNSQFQNWFLMQLYFKQSQEIKHVYLYLFLLLIKH